MQLEMHGRPVMKWMGLLVGMLGALFFFFAALMFIDEGNHAGALLASSTAGFLAAQRSLVPWIRWWQKVALASAMLIVLSFML